MLVLFVSLYADHTRWLGSYDRALEQAKQEHKPLMVLLVKGKCSLCNQIIRENFMNQPYVETLNEQYISVIVTYEGRANYPIEMYYSTEFPTLFFVDSNTEHFLSKPLYGKNISREEIEKLLAAKIAK